jgi:hypothetical protein
MPVIVPAERKISWSEIRKGIKAVIRAAAPTARVHNRWGLKYDITSTISKLISESDPNKLHAWMIKIREVTPQQPKVGGGETVYPLIIDVWGFMSYNFGTDESNSQDAFEDECDDVIAYLDANRLDAFGVAPEKRKYFRDMNIEENWDIDIASFGKGYDVHICKGVITGKVVRIK